MNELVKRLARSAARGWRQEQLVTELLSGHVPIMYNPFGIVVGESRVEWTSYRNLRNRLITQGFVFHESAPSGQWVGVKMTFPEKFQESK